MTPIRATWSSFFGSQNSRFESQFRTKTTIYTIQYTVYMQPKKQLKVQCIGIFEEIDSFWVILVNMVISVILGHEKTKIRNIIDYGKIDVFSVRTNIHIKNKMMGHLI